MTRTNRMAGWCMAGLLALTLPALAGPEESVLMANYLRYLLLNHIGAQGDALVARAPTNQQAALRGRLDEWQESYQQTIRLDLENRLGPDARDGFEVFVDRFTQAEQGRDMNFLETMAQATGWPGPMAGGYEAFRLWGIREWLAAEMDQGVAMLSEMEGQVIRATQSAPTTVAPPPPPANPLRAAEAAPSPMTIAETESGAPLQSFAGLREERRQRALDQSQAGMQQIAAERESWEQEYAATVASKAQKEADSMKRQSERLAATDAEALEQRKNSLGAKCIKVLAGVAEATVSGFTGAIGSRAAGEAVNAIFGAPKE